MTLANPERINNGCMIYRQSSRVEDEELAEAYAQEYSKNPHYPHETTEEAKSRRKRRGKKDGGTGKTA